MSNQYMKNTFADNSPQHLYVEDRAYGYDELVSKDVALLITGLGKSTFDKEVKVGHIPKIQYGETQQAKVQFLVRDLTAYRLRAYTRTLSTLDI